MLKRSSLKVSSVGNMINQGIDYTAEFIVRETRLDEAALAGSIAKRSARDGGNMDTTSLFNPSGICIRPRDHWQFEDKQSPSQSWSRQSVSVDV